MRAAWCLALIEYQDWCQNHPSPLWQVVILRQLPSVWHQSYGIFRSRTPWDRVTSCQAYRCHLLSWGSNLRYYGPFKPKSRCLPATDVKHLLNWLQGTHCEWCLNYVLGSSGSSTNIQFIFDTFLLRLWQYVPNLASTCVNIEDVLLFYPGYSRYFWRNKFLLSSQWSNRFFSFNCASSFTCDLRGLDINGDAMRAKFGTDRLRRYKKQSMNVAPFLFFVRSSCV